MAPQIKGQSARALCDPWLMAPLDRFAGIGENEPCVEKLASATGSANSGFAGITKMRKTFSLSCWLFGYMSISEVVTRNSLLLIASIVMSFMGGGRVPWKI